MMAAQEEEENARARHLSEMEQRRVVRGVIATNKEVSRKVGSLRRVTTVVCIIFVCHVY